MPAPTILGCRDAALAYLSRGWSVLPLCPPDHHKCNDQHLASCTRPGKTPIWPWKEYQDKLPTPSAIKLLWHRNPTANVGIIMGPVSGILGLDIDGPEGEQFLAEHAQGECTPTLEFLTPGGGRRLLFKWPTGLELNAKSFQIGGKEAVRIQAQHCQTVAPPSLHTSGKKYEWVQGRGPEDIKPAECPAWVIELASQKKKDDQVKVEHNQPPLVVPATVYERALAFVKKCDPAIAGQGGHNQTYKVANRLVRGFALDINDAVNLLLAHYNPTCQPPWTEKELAHKCQDALTHGTEPMGHLLMTTNHPAIKTNSKTANQDGQIIAVTRSFDKIVKKPIDWLWKPWIPLGKLAILDGDPGLGKSTMLLDLAARVSLDGVMPDGSQGVQGNVLLMSAEDAADDTILPRLQAANANLANIDELNYILKGKEEVPPEIPGDIPWIEHRIKERKIRLLVIDPLMAFLYGADANKDQEIRRVLYKLSKIAEKNGTAIICMRHLNKGGGNKAIYRGNSSIGVIGHARTGLIVAQDPDNEDERVLAVSKCNLAAKPSSLRFALEPHGEVCSVTWKGTCNHTADQLVATPPSEEEQEAKEEHKSKVEQAKAILEMLLHDKGKIEIQEAKKELAKAGLQGMTVTRAVQKLDLQTSYSVDPHGERKYYWSLDGTAPI